MSVGVSLPVCAFGWVNPIVAVRRVASLISRGGGRVGRRGGAIPLCPCACASCLSVSVCLQGMCAVHCVWSSK